MRMHSAVKEVPMSKKVLILSGSPRKGGNSDILCDEFLRGAQDAGHKAEKIHASGYLAKKFRTVKVKLKAGYRVMLYAKQQ